MGGRGRGVVEWGGERDAGATHNHAMQHCHFPSGFEK